MSDARSFAQDSSEKTLEERLAVLEQKIPSYQDRIAAYDALFDEMRALVLKVEAEKEKTDSYRKALDSLGENVANLHNSQVERINKLQTDLITHKDETGFNISKQNDLKDSVEKTLESLSEKIDAHKKSFQSSLDSKASAADLVNLQSSTNSNTNVQNKQMVDLKRSVDCLVHDLQGKVQEFKDSCIEKTTHFSEIESVNSKLTTFKAELANVKDFLSSIIVQLEGKIAKSCDSLRNELSSKPSELVDMKNDIAKKLEAIGLDANSANIRSQNTDKKVFLLEKQLENAQLLIKKLELK